MSEIIVLKCGGSIIDTLSASFFANIKTLQESGLKPIIVHGGGPAIEEMLTDLQIETEFIDGLRKTTEQVMDVVEMVLTGIVNNEITRKLNDEGIQSIGLSGSDVQLLKAKPKDFEKFGYVGEVTDVNVEFLQGLLDSNVVPVITPIALGNDGERYNINADTAAGAIAAAVAAKQLIFVTDVPGILRENKLLECVTEEEINQMIQVGTIYGGMIPKVEAALSSLNEDLQEAMIIDGNQSVVNTKEVELVGTVIRKSVGVVQNACAI
jgi:acetylglutamate kinase